jgi:hypothetical protein
MESVVSKSLRARSKMTPNNLRIGEVVQRINGGPPCIVWAIEHMEVLLNDNNNKKSFWVGFPTFFAEWQYVGAGQ